jgi:hypothetical protein
MDQCQESHQCPPLLVSLLARSLEGATSDNAAASVWLEEVVAFFPLKNQFGIWRYKFPLQIKLIFIIPNIFVNFSIIMFYLQENCIHVQIPCMLHKSFMKIKKYNFLHEGKNLFLFDIIFILQYHSLLCNNIIPTQSHFSLPKQLFSKTTKYFFFVHLYCF